MTFSAFVAIAFRFINLFVLLYIIYYVFNKYMRASLEEAVTEQESYEMGLQEQHHMLQVRLQESKQEQKIQEQECLTLQHKVDLWQENYAAYIAKKRAITADLHKQLTQRVEKQQEELVLDVLARQALEQALPRVHAELQKQYANHTRVERYVTSALSALKKGDL